MFMRWSLPKSCPTVQYRVMPAAHGPRPNVPGQNRALRTKQLYTCSVDPVMQLPDEAITYQYQSVLVPAKEDWTPAAELRASHCLPAQALKDLLPRLTQVRSQVAAEREPRVVPPELEPLQAGFI